MSKTVTDFRSCAQLVFNKINEGWGDWTTDNFNFWRVGNAFDTLIDYFVNVDASNVGLAASALQLFDGGKGGAWFDDFGWWGIAFLRAVRHASLLYVNPLTCLHSSTTCWQKMDDNAPLVWAKADQQTFRRAKPRFAGGCWNNSFSVCDPFVERLCGFQNTVTNGLYQVLAARSFQWWHTLPYLDAAKREYNWLGQWFFHPDLTADEKLLFTDTSGRKLVRERVSTYDLYDGSYPEVGYYEPKLHWVGDQGLILSAMVDLAPIMPIGPRDTLYNIARGILEGVRSLLVDSQGILQPWIPSGEDFQGDNSNYATGVGIYMRYLLHAFQRDITLKRYILQTYKPFIQINAEAVCDSIGSCPALPDGSALGGEMECLLNQLAVLNAAVVILR